jgi:hypothetical protein
MAAHLRDSAHPRILCAECILNLSTIALGSKSADMAGADLSFAGAARFAASQEEMPDSLPDRIERRASQEFENILQSHEEELRSDHKTQRVR